MEALLLALLGALKLSAKLLLIVVPLVTLFEVLRYHPVFRRAGRAVEPMMRGMGLSPQAAVPLFTGIFLGIAYGAGIIIRVAQEKRLPGRELFLMGLFLATCHAVVEDTLIFVVIGGNGWIMLGVRLLIAFGLTAVLAWLWRRKKNDEDNGKPAGGA
ncbi:MAG TPA: nucleoside recognition domain-containing protein [Desulfuromonadales bacterium]|nr:nucleoside recognition domain-containing protein [Desulfuromonadales bacterium]